MTLGIACWLGASLFVCSLALAIIAGQLTWWLPEIAEQLKELASARRNMHSSDSWKEALHEARLEAIRHWLHCNLPPTECNQFGTAPTADQPKVDPFSKPVPPEKTPGNHIHLYPHVEFKPIVPNPRIEED